MLRYILRRLLQMIPTVVGVILITFILFNLVPNDMAMVMLGKKAGAEDLQQFDVKRGLDKPLFFGIRASERAYADTDFSKGPDRWQNTWSNAVYSAEMKTVSIAPGTSIQGVVLEGNGASSSVQPLFAYKLDTEKTYEWNMRFRGEGTLAGKAISSKHWKTVKVRFRGDEDGSICAGTTGLEFKSLCFRRIQSNPFDSQLVHFARQIAQGDLGYSMTFQQPVARLMKAGIPVSLKLMIPIFLVQTIVAVVLALLCAFFRNTWIDRSFVILSVALMSINYIVYIVAGQYILSYKAGWFPIWGYESWRYLLLPVLIGVISGLGANLRFYRTIMLDEMYKDYVRTAFAKGVSKSRVLFVHVLKNAMIPIISSVGTAIPFLFTGSLLLERYFGLPGLGYLGLNAIQQSDFDVVRSLVLVSSLLFVASNLLTDICYALFDPRVKLK